MHFDKFMIHKPLFKLLLALSKRFDNQCRYLFYYLLPVFQKDFITGFSNSL